MSKFIFVCHKKNANEVSHIENICNNLKPDNLEPKKPYIYSDNKGVTFGIFNPNDSNLIKDTSVCLGYVDSENWFEVGSGIPDGNFAIVRSNSYSLEVITDIVATRTVWYVYTDDYFVASTSQRMLISYLGDYIQNDKVIPWILSTGTLGYRNSWDKRIKCVPGDSKLILNRNTWELELNTNDVVFNIVDSNYSSNKEKLAQAINNNLKKINLDLSQWALPLSGGYDSRGILFNLEKKENLKTITWGLESSMQEPGSDAFVAKQLSEKFSLNHHYFNTDFSNEPIRDIFERYFKIGEGRIDNVGGYLDGFSLWNNLYDEGIVGIIRGDEGFGWTDVRTEKDVRVGNGINYTSDFDNIKPFINDELENKLPVELLKRENESMEQWRDRIYHQYRIPTILAALNDLKLSHVELINPLLSREIISTVRTIPDGLRTSKKLYKEIVDSFGIDIPYAKYGSNMNFTSIFKQKEVVDEIRREIQETDLIPETLIRFILTNLNDNTSTKKTLSRKGKLILNIKAVLPSFVKDLLKRNIPTNIDVNLLAFRVYMIVRMNKILKSDATLLKEKVAQNQ